MQNIKCLAPKHNTVPPLRLESTTLDQESSTLPLSHCAPQVPGAQNFFKNSIQSFENSVDPDQLASDEAS